MDRGAGVTGRGGVSGAKPSFGFSGVVSTKRRSPRSAITGLLSQPVKRIDRPTSACTSREQGTAIARYRLARSSGRNLWPHADTGRAVSSIPIERS